MELNKMNITKGLLMGIIFLMICSLPVSLIGGQVQKDLAQYDMPVLVKGKDQVSLVNTIKKIEEKFEVNILFRPHQVHNKYTYMKNISSDSLAFELEKLLSPLNMTFEIINSKNLIIYDKNEPVMDEAAQETVTGEVTDAQSGETLPGVNVMVKGTTTGTSTDSEGSFELTVESLQDTLVFSFVGYQTQEIPINGREVIDIALQTQAISGEELVVVGYGTQQRSDVTGAVSSVNTEQLSESTYENAVESLQGRMAGVSVQSTNADPGRDDFKIRIRGTTSINANSDPLYVVDGLVGGIIPRPEDIASVEVLKDASATAIYGSRGSNGVVMITTKSGSPGVVEVNYNGTLSTQKEIGRLELLNARQFAEYINEARGTEFYDLNSLDTDTDWQDLIFQPGSIQNHQLSISGGSENIDYYVSGVYYDQKGLIKTSVFDQYSLTTNFNFELSESVRVNLNSIMQRARRDGVLTQTGGGVANAGAVTAALRFDPTLGITDGSNDYTKSEVGIAAFENPMAVIDGREEENREEDYQINIKAEFDITKGMIFNSTFGTTIRNQRDGIYHNRISNAGESSNGEGNMRYGKNVNFLTEQYLNYDFNVGDNNNFIITGGISYQKFQNESFAASNTGFISDALGFWDLGAGTNLQAPNSNITSSVIASFYGRINYNYDDRYLLTGTGRYDGASQFSEGNKWSYFPSGAFSWNISNEKFYPANSKLTDLKIRVSYGLSGNQAIGPYESLARITPTFFVFNNASVPSVRPSAIANTELTWETTAQFNAGLDLELFNGRINLTGDYYHKKTSDLLFQVPVPSFSGFQNRLENLGEIENKGFEFQLSSENLVNAFKWNTTFNITFNRNKVLSLPGGNDIIAASVPSFTGSVENSILREGEPLGSFYGFIYEGVYQEGDEFIPGGAFETEPGGEKFADINNDGVLNSDDRRIIGDPNPDAIWGFNNDFSYKGFNANIFLQASVGGDMLNLVRLELDRLSGNSNATTKALDRWTPENTGTNVPKAASGRVPRTSTRFVEDGSFVRLKNISLSYDISSNVLSKLKLKSARIYITGKNILTFTDYSGVDPEVAFRSSNTNLGLDYGSYPNTISYIFGVNLGF